MSGVPAQSAIILAGRRAGKAEPLAELYGVSDKCLVPLRGRALIEFVADTLSTSPLIDKIVVSINDPEIIARLPVCGALIREGRMVAIRAQGNLADSVLDAVAHTSTPVLVTTADNALLTHDAIARIFAATSDGRADAAAAFARREDILAAHPDGQRRFYEFRDGGYSNCNCYWIGNAHAVKAAEIFRSGGQFAKNPMRLASAFGILNLIRFRLGMSTLEDSLLRISRRLGLSLRPVVMSDGSLAIDVDNERTYRVVDALLARRGAAAADA